MGTAWGEGMEGSMGYGMGSGRRSGLGSSMAGRVTVTWDVGFEEWRRALRAVPGATFFHTPGWYQTHAQQGGYHVFCVGIRWSDGQEAWLPLALRRRFRGWLQEAVSGVEGGYGGLLSAQPLPPHRIEEAFAQVRAQFPNLRVLGNPLGVHSCLPPTGVVSESFTQAVPILSPESQRERMSEMRRRHLRKAERSGFQLECLHPVMPSDARTVLPVYQEHSSRWTYRRWVRDEAYFRALFRCAGDDLWLFLAYHGDAVAGFLLLGAWGDTLVELHLSTREAYESLQVGTFLIGKALEWGHQQGYRVFDFLPSGNLSGIIAYKDSFGSERLTQVEVVQESAWSRGLAYLRSALKRDGLASAPRAADPSA